MKSKILESAGYISIALILALTLVLSFSVVEFDSGVTAQAAEESVFIGGEEGANSVPIAPGAVLLFSDFEDELVPLFSTDSNFNPDIDLSSLNLTGGVYQIVCKAIVYGDDDFTSDDDYTTYLTNLVYIDSEFPSQVVSLSDYGYGDSLFTVVFSPEYLTADFFNSFQGYDFAQVLFYALYKIEGSPANEPIADNFFSIIGDGISFGFEAIADGITYTVENLFFVDGRLSDFSIIIFCVTGVSLALAVIKYILRFVFSFGGKKL